MIDWPVVVQQGGGSGSMGNFWRKIAGQIEDWTQSQHMAERLKDVFADLLLNLFKKLI